jgi:hypothetical protein
MKGGLVMEVLVIPYDSRLQLSLITGINPESGKPIIKKTYFNNVKYDADEQDVYDVANQLISLQKCSFESIDLNKSMQLTS